MKNRKILIIGGGIAGLCSGIYLQKNGFETEILEMHSIAGGLATAWKRNGYTFENCVHWLLGSREGEELHATWKEIFDIGQLQFFDDEVYEVIEKGNQTLTVYRDIDRLKSEFLAKAPGDSAAIQEFVSVVRDLADFRMPGGDSVIPRLLSFARTVPYLRLMSKYSKYDLATYGSRFQNPLLKRFFSSALGDLSFLALAFSLAWMSKRNAGYPIGGSLKLIGLIEDQYKRLGGRIRFGARVKKVKVAEGKACGVVLESGEEIPSNAVISAADGHSTIFQLLGGKFVGTTIKRAYDTYKPFPSYVQVSLGVNADLKGEAGFLARYLENSIQIDPETRKELLTFRIFNFDPTFAPPGKTAVVSFIDTYNHSYWIALRNVNGAKYEAEKNRIASEVIDVFEERFPAARGKVEVVDVATPATVVRYTGNWKGSMEGWLMTPATGIRPLPTTLPGLNNFYMVGQWVSPGGGLPSGLLTARAVSRLICRDNHIKWRVE